MGKKISETKVEATMPYLWLGLRSILYVSHKPALILCGKDQKRVWITGSEDQGGMGAGARLRPAYVFSKTSIFYNSQFPFLLCHSLLRTYHYLAYFIHSPYSWLLPTKECKSTRTAVFENVPFKILSMASDTAAGTQKSFNKWKSDEQMKSRKMDARQAIAGVHCTHKVKVLEKSIL